MRCVQTGADLYFDSILSLVKKDTAETLQHFLLVSLSLLPLFFFNHTRISGFKTPFVVLKFCEAVTLFTLIVNIYLGFFAVNHSYN